MSGKECLDVWGVKMFHVATSFFCLTFVLVELKTIKSMHLCFRSFQRWSVRLSRLTHRCGYGVHSPFAFGLITDVVYERRPYYAYAELRKAYEAGVKDGRWEGGSRRVNELMFRLSNRIQPHTVCQVGENDAAHLYLHRAKPASTLHLCRAGEVGSKVFESIDLLYLAEYAHPYAMEETFEHLLPAMNRSGLVAVRGIGYSKEMRTWWQRLKEHPQVGITFDLYDVGLVFLDLTRFKQHYSIFY